MNNKNFESGRSMVEMLGVLAVMGVLSVGGVAMYTSAMNKYRANEILNEASKRAVMVAGQLLTNPSATTMSLAQFGSNTVTGATFKDDAAISNGKITLTVSGVETAVCNQMIAATGTNSAMQVAPGCGTITFNTDMSKGEGSDTTTATCNSACNSTQECVDGNCITKADPNDSSSCAKNSDCDDWCKNQTGAAACYCQISASSTGTENACYNNFTGTCGTISSTEKDQKYKETHMSWWSAQNFCKAIGHSMVSATDACGSNADPYTYPSGCTSTPNYYWLSDCWCNKDSDSTCTCNDHSCSAFAVDTSAPVNVSYYSRNGGNFIFALCEQYSRISDKIILKKTPVKHRRFDFYFGL